MCPSPVDRAPRFPSECLGIATTAMTTGEPRYSASDALLEAALEHTRAGNCSSTRSSSGCGTCRSGRCEGFYSKAAEACTWPCSITKWMRQIKMDRECMEASSIGRT